jgi:hypothetical protein
LVIFPNFTTEEMVPSSLMPAAVILSDMCNAEASDEQRCSISSSTWDKRASSVMQSNRASPLELPREMCSLVS